MIKTRTVKVGDVLCDVCGDDTGYHEESAYVAERAKHFCGDHAVVGKTFEQMLDLDCRQSAIAFFEEYMSLFSKKKEKSE